MPAGARSFAAFVIFTSQVMQLACRTCAATSGTRALLLIGGLVSGSAALASAVYPRNDKTDKIFCQPVYIYFYELYCIMEFG
jgi:hypothetical protein